LEDLLRQRRQTLRTLVDVAEKHYRTGRVPFDVVVRASNDLWEAELALAKGKEERLRLRAKIVENLRKLEDLVQARFQLGKTTLDEVLSAKAARLKAEILLLAEKEGLPSPY
jgi:outer membrane protein TolC